MAASHNFSPGSSDRIVHTQQLEDFLDHLMLDPDREPVVSELQALLSIYGEDSVRLWHPNDLNGSHTNSDNIRYEVSLNLASPREDVEIRILASLPATYPATSPPQLQLLSKYIGAFGVDPPLFGSILRTFISRNGVGWSADTVCVFDGLQSVLERCEAWYTARLSSKKTDELLSQDVNTLSGPLKVEDSGQIFEISHSMPSDIPEDVEIVEAVAITDRKSSFIGRACHVSHPSQVKSILSHLMTDRRISRAAHPIINAWRCQVGNLLHQDNDDNGETAAGGRLAHLLQILEVNNVLVVVTRHFGGIHLGPDRFKHINQAARNALELGGFLDTPDMKNTHGRRKRR